MSPLFRGILVGLGLELVVVGLLLIVWSAFAGPVR
jgi:hypothetical protein